MPLALLVAYGLLRLSTTVFTELREFLFAKVTQRAVRKIALKVFRHLHALSLRFHLARQTGGLTRDVERGQRGISTLISFALFSILPTLVEIALVSAILIARYDWTFIAITVGALALYIAFTVADHRVAHALPARDERARLARPTRARSTACSTTRRSSTSATRSWEARRYDESLQRWETGGGEEPDVAVGAQHRPERDHRRRGDADHVARDGRRRRGPDDDRRPRAGQRAS